MFGHCDLLLTCDFILSFISQTIKCEDQEITIWFLRWLSALLIYFHSYDPPSISVETHISHWWR